MYIYINLSSYVPFSCNTSGDDDASSNSTDKSFSLSPDEFVFGLPSNLYRAILASNDDAISLTAAIIIIIIINLLLIMIIQFF